MIRQKKTIIIAEAGVNHNGNLDCAKALIDAASEANVDFVKFQTFTAETLVVSAAEKAEYQRKRTGDGESQYRMLKKLELGDNAHFDLIKYCNHKGIGFLSTAFDIKSIDFLATLGLEFFKIPSGEITNLPYLRHIGEQGKPIILSTGMATLSEIKDALWILEKSGSRRSAIIVLQCNTEYPTPMVDVNLQAMLTIRDECGTQVGYSDHTLGIEVPVAAVALGATVIEKHFTLNRSMPGPDHQASLEPDELKAMVQAIRNIELAMGNGVKQPSPSEIKNRTVARKSIVAARNIKKGEIFSKDNLTIKRPGTGISPMFYDDLLGTESAKAYRVDELIIQELENNSI